LLFSFSRSNHDLGATEKRKSNDFVVFSVISGIYDDFLIFHSNPFLAISSVVAVLPRSTVDAHAVPITEPSKMGTVAPRKRSDGSLAYQAQLLI
jgi:hypothetical protein